MKTILFGKSATLEHTYTNTNTEESLPGLEKEEESPFWKDRAIESKNPLPQ